MSKKLQVFISSTYIDLIPERQAAVQAVLMSGHIPAGMELFTAGDADQLQVIKRWIDASDVYCLILGGRYGSVEPESGKSYTEVEYDYAVSSGKPYFALVLNPEAIAKKTNDKALLNESFQALANLEVFRAKTLSKMSRIIANPAELGQHVVLALVKLLTERPELEGWVRGSQVLNVGTLMEQIKSNQVVIRNLEKQISAHSAAPPIPSFPLDLKLQLNGSHQIGFNTSSWRDFAMDTFVGFVFKRCALRWLAWTAVRDARSQIARAVKDPEAENSYDYRLKDQSWDEISSLFEVHSLIEIKNLPMTDGGHGLYLILTQAGRMLANTLNMPGVQFWSPPKR